MDKSVWRRCDLRDWNKQSWFVKIGKKRSSEYEPNLKQFIANYYGYNLFPSSFCNISPIASVHLWSLLIADISLISLLIWKFNRKVSNTF